MEYNEIEGDIFLKANPHKQIFCHCIAADGLWGAGIAPKMFEFFREENHMKPGGGILPTSFESESNPGKCIILMTRRGVLANLITKAKTNQKPTYKSLENSLIDLKSKLEMELEDYQYPQNSEGVFDLVMPKIGCGIDGLEWKQVSFIIKCIFEDTDYAINVYFK
jgi:hypothetical protein